MIVEKVPVGAVIVDSLPFSDGGTNLQAANLKADRVDGIAGYLGAMTPARLEDVLSEGLGFMPVTFAGEYNDGPNDEVAQLQALGIPAGTSVWLDLEGMKAFKTDPIVLAARIDAWATTIEAHGWIPMLYVGVPQPLTSDELWRLKVRGYWRGQGSIRDRYNALAEPTGCGWMMTQMYPSHMRGSTWVDVNMVGQDYRGRVPMWLRRG